MSIQGDRSFEQILSDNKQTTHEMFQIPGILSKIKLNLQSFINFCLDNEDFLKEMIIIGIKIPMHGNPNRKQVAHIALEILTCDNDSIAELFVVDKNRQRIRLYSQDDDEIVEEIITNEETGELVIVDIKKSGKQDLANKFANLIDLLDYTNQKLEDIDENCMNYMMKVFGTLVRVIPEDMYQFFEYKPQYLSNLIKLTVFPCVCYGLVKLLNEVEKQQIRNKKSKIILRILEQLKNEISSDKFSCVLELVQDLFSKNKFRSEQPDDLKIISNPLVNEETIHYFVDRLVDSSNEIVLDNALMYLVTVVKRMNMDEEKDPYSYYQEKNQGPTMEFQVDYLYENMGRLIELSEICLNRKQQVKNTTLFNFYQLLYVMTKHSIFTKYKQKFGARQLVILLKSYNSLKTNGIIKFYLIGLIESLLMANSSCIQNEIDKKKIIKLIGEMEKGLERTEAIGYNNKIRVMFAPIVGGKYIDVYDKYSNTLCPNNYTTKRENPIPELQFIKRYEPPVQRNNEHSQNDIQQTTEKVQNSQEEHKKIINLDILDMKIKKRQQKLSQIRESQKQNILILAKDQELKMNVEIHEKKPRKQKIINQCIEFYSKHMIIF